jgi:hypothetical protein
LIKQISVFLDNSPGELERLTKILMNNQINMRALTVAETADFGILRMIVDNVDKCINVLRDQEYLLSQTEVIAVSIPDKPGGLHSIVELLAKEDINIEYVYSALVREKAIIIFRIDDMESASKVLKENNINVMETQNF